MSAGLVTFIMLTKISQVLAWCRISKNTHITAIMNDEKFIPRGAIAFLVLLLVLAAAIWFGVYFRMLALA